MLNILRRLIGCCLVAMMALAGVATETSAQALKKVTFRMDYIPSGIYSAFYYAKQRGHYAKAGYDVEILPGVGSGANADSLIRGDLDVALASCWGLAVLIGTGREVVSVATFTGRSGFGFFVPKDSGIKTLKDLEGKKISTAPTSLTTMVFPAVLANSGLSPNLMQKLSVDPAQTVPTYTRGQADVIATHIPFGDPLIQQQRPSDLITWASTGFILPDFCIAVSKDRLAKDPTFIQNFLKVTYEAAAEAAKKPEEAAAAAVELNPLLDKKTTLRQWELMKDYFYSDDTKSCPHGWHSPSDWTATLKTLKEYAGLQGSIDDHSKFYTNKFFSCTR